MKINSVTISGMHNVANRRYDFNNINYLHGPNGAGKSTVLQAVQLAILGYIPGMAKLSSTIYQNASLPEMKIRVQFDDGRHIERAWNAKGRSIDSVVSGDFDADSIKSVVGDLELPIFNFNELVGLTANKLKDWFINFLPSASADISWKDELLNATEGIEIMDASLLPGALAELNGGDRSVLQKLQDFNASLKAKQSLLKSELQRSDGTIQSLIYYDEDDLIGDAEYLNNEIQKAQESIVQLTSEKEAAIRAAQIIESNKNVRTQLDVLENASAEDENQAELDARHDEIVAQISRLEKEIADATTQINSLIQQRGQLQAETQSKLQIIQKQGICPYTSSKCNSIVEMIESFKTQVNDNQTAMNSLSTSITELQQTINSKKAEINELAREMQTIQYSTSQIETRKVTAQKLRSMLQQEPDLSQFSDVTWYASEIDRLNQRIAKIRANQQYNSLIDRLTSEKYRIENTIEVYKCWIKLTDPNGLQTKVMNEPFKDLASTMDEYLSIMFSDDIHCKFNLEQKANSFSFGITRNGKYIPYDLLSSGEKTMYTLAMMMCIVHRSSSPLKILIVDDMLDHLDNDRADDVFKSIGNIGDIQVIIAGVKDSENAKPYTIEISK